MLEAQEEPISGLGTSETVSAQGKAYQRIQLNQGEQQERSQEAEKSKGMCSNPFALRAAYAQSMPFAAPSPCTSASRIRLEAWWKIPSLDGQGAEWRKQRSVALFSSK